LVVAFTTGLVVAFTAGLVVAFTAGLVVAFTAGLVVVFTAGFTGAFDVGDLTTLGAAVCGEGGLLEWPAAVTEHGSIKRERERSVYFICIVSTCTYS
jgi:hypothetical protein